MFRLRRGKYPNSRPAGAQEAARVTEFKGLGLRGALSPITPDPEPSTLTLSLGTCAH